MNGAPTRPAWRAVAMFSAGMAIALLALRWWFLCRYGISQPFRDQWGGEAALLFKPLVEGTFDVSLLWQPHNEHRILMTRLWAILMFEANGMQFDPRVEALANSLLLALFFGIACFWMRRHLSAGMAFALALAALALYALPFGWENTVFGLQSCFYFVLFFCLATIAAAARLRDGTWSLVVLLAFCIASIFSLAAGVFGAAAAMVVIALRAWNGKVSPRVAAIACVVLGAILCAGIADTLALSRLGGFEAQETTGLLDAIWHVFGWPLGAPFGLLAWAPLAVALVCALRRRALRESDYVLIGVALWSALICLSMAYSRGRGLQDVAPRYVDLLVPGLLSNAGLSWSLVRGGLGRWSGWRAALPALAMAVLLTGGFHRVHAAYQQGLEDMVGAMQVDKGRVRDYFAGDVMALDRPSAFLSAVVFDGPWQVANTLADPTIASFMPLSIRRVGPSGQHCAWTLQPAGADPRPAGTVRCDETARSAEAVAVGPLSVVAYHLWKALRSDWMTVVGASERALSDDPAASCVIDMINGESGSDDPLAQVAHAAALKIEGWARPGAGRSIVFVGEDDRHWAAPLTTVVERADVATAFADARYAQAGFSGWFDASALPAGRYALKVADADGSACATARALSIRHATDERLLY